MTRPGTIVIRTPEGIEFRLQLAGIFSRMLAFSIDVCVIAAAGRLLGMLTAMLKPLQQDTSEALYVFFYFAISILYGIVTEWLWKGQTIGKKLLGLRVVDASGLRLKLEQIIVRNIVRLVDLLPWLYLVGGTACFLSSRRQRLGDLAAGTVVVLTPKLRAPDVHQLMGGKFNSFSEYQTLIARLRQRANPELAHLALEALLRRDELEPAARLILFREFADQFKSTVRFPEEIAEQLSNEQYVRNVLGVLLQRSSLEVPAKGFIHN